ncbi:hypothetical protein JL721_12128 [Aureococcus anophagefferens]|nr:hypothetical protein JL721_12128 [Aureococcus anophagefferens]
MMTAAPEIAWGVLVRTPDTDARHPQFVALCAESVVLGRRPERYHGARADRVRLAHSRVSGVQCLLHVNLDGVRLEQHARASNETKVNGHTIADARRLESGDTITLLQSRDVIKYDYFPAGDAGEDRLEAGGAVAPVAGARRLSQERSDAAALRAARRRRRRRRRTRDAELAAAWPLTPARTAPVDDDDDDGARSSLTTARAPPTKSAPPSAAEAFAGLGDDGALRAFRGAPRGPGQRRVRGGGAPRAQAVAPLDSLDSRRAGREARRVRVSCLSLGSDDNSATTGARRAARARAAAARAAAAAATAPNIAPGRPPPRLERSRGGGARRGRPPAAGRRATSLQHTL